MKRSIALLSLLLLTMAACGGGDDAASTSARGASPTPTDATATPTPTDEDEESDGGSTAPPTSAPDDDSSGDAGAGGQEDDPAGNDAGDGSGSQQPQAAGEGQVNRPATGDYVYDLDGTTTDPFNPAGREYPDDATQTVEVSRDGDVYSSKTTNSEESGASTTRVRWEADRALLLMTKQEQPGVTFSCTFEPPVEILHIPIRAETFPTQQWSSDNCEGTTDITVVGEEDVQDANGNTWSTWRIEQETDYTFRSGQGTATGTLQTTTWFSPDLGNGVKSHNQNDGEFKNQTGTGQEFHSDTTTTLISHP